MTKRLTNTKTSDDPYPYLLASDLQQQGSNCCDTAFDNVTENGKYYFDLFLLINLMTKSPISNG